MVSLKQVTQVTVSSAWSQSDVSRGATGRGSVPNPSYPVFFFDYATSQIAVGYVVGTTGYSLYNQGDCNYLTMPAVYLQVVGLPYVIGGGGECGPQNGCMGNGPDVCGPWWFIYNMTNNTVTVTCTLIPNNGITGHFQGIGLDLINQYMLMSFISSNAKCLIIIIIPISCLSTLLSGTYPSKASWAYVASPSPMPNVYAQPFTIYGGYLYQPGVSSANTSNNICLWIIPLSCIYAKMTNSSLPSSATPITMGSVITVYSGSVPGIGLLAFSFANATTSGLSFYIAVGGDTSSGCFIYGVVNPSNNTVCFTCKITGLYSQGYAKGAFNGVFIVPGYNSGTVYVTAVDPKNKSVCTTSVSGYYEIMSSEGYIVVASNPLSNSTVTFTVYQILLSATYAFQNASITVSGATVTGSGTLVNENNGSAVGGVTVYLVGVKSLGDMYTNDVDIIASGTTNSAGQFSISGAYNSQYKWYGLLYVP
jgi:hypothetical protein